ncbi:hypothetical protein B0H67DRAFT_603057 [Lasiosphaeris hirsuta]|uniref:Uncharacterized protein n=1 Tax=Lasiosphaeris hirsuta TaxID=260670 RepID=A0AA40DNQ4_9PEZI|nr:hypothetical protein B0H67DRAFT_603057 [Lasiosphaeris hirsuta]
MKQSSACRHCLSPAAISAYTALSSLERLPNELLQPIAAGLVPAAPLTTRFALRPTGTWEFRDAGHQWADWLAGHQELLAFAQTSQRMAAVAKPLLYHTLVIHSAADLVTLFRRMSRRPEIKPWVRDITCLVNVAGVNTVDAVYLESARQAGVKWQPPYRGTHNTLALELLRDIVLSAPNLQNFLVAFPDHELPDRDPGPKGLDLLVPPFRDALLEYVTTPYPANFTRLPFAPLLPFNFKSKLTSLRIYCHREELDREFSFSRVLADYAVSTLASMTHLKTLELCSSSFGGFMSDGMRFAPLPHIEHLRLYGSYLHEPRLVNFCLACVNLQTLLVHFERTTTDEDRDKLPEGKTLNDSLICLSGTLRNLELVALSEGHYLTRGRERPRKPENHRLTCIPQLGHLENLTLDYRGVFGTLGILEEDDGERLCQLLPHSLRDFTLVCEWGTTKDWKQSYLANLDMILYGVEHLCTNTQLLPRLASISLAIHSWPAKSRFHRRFKREVERVRLICARVGIQFRTFDLLPCYRDEDEVESVEEDDFEDEEGVDEDEEAAGIDEEDYELELEEEDEASEYYFSGDEESDPEREARRPKSFDDFLQRLGEDHGHNMDELFYAFHEDRWDEYLF